ncbi:hypothetical protein L2E82_05078 [Cichorium intybus]|uniref:Uncharacterized protein n=2 Tax=Cichorium intybus TaxID=13427 RepID=A0ACB9H7T6_CICIN|nr:hypothetical protein L2E82_05071 [Cichorium intybus]KAI3791327.1 hypothetical protein L2E82_05078 [Cichorium intybus]
MNMKHKSVDTNTKKKKGRIHTTVLEAMKSEEAMLKLQSITKLEPVSGVVGFEPMVTQRRRRSPVCVVEPLTGGWRSNGDRRSSVCVVGGRLVAAVDRWLEVELNEEEGVEQVVGAWRLTGGWSLGG